MAKVEGHADAPFEKLRGLLEQQIASGDEVGASIVVNVDGKNVVDLWGGYFDEERTQPWASDTITNVWSSTKTVASLGVLVAAERGLLDLDAPVSASRPNFTQDRDEERDHDDPVGLESAQQYYSHRPLGCKILA